jgi:hypothetical protein
MRAQSREGFQVSLDPCPATTVRAGNRQRNGYLPRPLQIHSNSGTTKASNYTQIMTSVTAELD